MQLSVEEIWEEDFERAPSITVEEKINFQANAERLKIKKGNKGFSDLILYSCPGLVGEIADWITETSQHPQHELSLAVTLTALGVLKGHRVQTETGLRTNLYCLGVANAGSGKGHPMKAWNNLLTESGQLDIRCGAPASGPAIEGLLEKRNGRALLMWDEIGLHLQSAMSTRSASYEQKVIPTLLSIFSDSDTLHYGRELADQKLNKSIVIDQPCLGVFGATTPETLYTALTSSSITSGFLPRWLVFPISNPDAENRTPKERVIPQRFIDEIVRISNMTTNAFPTWEGDISIKPKVVPFSDSARNLIEQIKDDFKVSKVAEREAGSGLDALWARAWEQTCKVALIVCNDKIIDATDLIWAYSLVSESFNLSISTFLAHSFENQVGKDMQTILNYVVENPGVSSREALRKFKMKASDFFALTNTLIERGDIVQSIESGSNGKKSKRFWAQRL
jgi:hypothetical protein